MDSQKAMSFAFDRRSASSFDIPKNLGSEVSFSRMSSMAFAS